MLIVQPQAGAASTVVRISSPERLVLWVTLAAQLLALVAAFVLQREVHWLSFILPYVASLGWVWLGYYIRSTKGKPRLGLALSGLGYMLAFPSAFSVFVYTLLPLTNPMVDLQLTQIGHWFGYDWRTFLIAMVDFPTVSRILGIIYHSALPQMMLTVLVLASYGLGTQLFRYLFVGMVTLVLTTAIWWVWPSVGYVGVLPYSDEQLRAIGYTFGPDRGGLLTRLLTEGPGVITPAVITGVVGFPSYHTVITLLVMWYLRGTFLFWPLLPVNILMIPATLLHGGHHIADLAGGLAVFASVVVLAHRLMPQPKGAADAG